MTQKPALPDAPIGRLMGLLEVMRETPGPDDVYRLGGGLQLELDDLVPLIDAAELLGLVSVAEGDYELTEVGRHMADAEERDRKQLFRERAATVPLLQAIRDRLAASDSGQVPREDIRELIEGDFSRKRSERQIDTAIDWGRYAELFDYDADAQHFVKLTT
ncbi:MAG: AAA-associated domain-containing protein [Bacteroidales bacterium]